MLARMETQRRTRIESTFVITCATSLHVHFGLRVSVGDVTVLESKIQSRPAVLFTWPIRPSQRNTRYRTSGIVNLLFANVPSCVQYRRERSVIVGEPKVESQNAEHDQDGTQPSEPHLRLLGQVVICVEHVRNHEPTLPSQELTAHMCTSDATEYSPYLTSGSPVSGSVSAVSVQRVGSQGRPQSVRGAINETAPISLGCFMRPWDRTAAIGVFATVLVLGIVVASCSNGVSETTTSRAAQPGTFVVERPDNQTLGLYLFYASTILPDTEWTQEAMGDEPWLRMLENGALTACASYHNGASTIDAVREVIKRDEVPLQDAVPSSDDPDAYDLLSVIFIGGIDAYCPDLIETIYGSVMAVGFDDAWENLTGGPAPSRPIRLPGS